MSRPIVLLCVGSLILAHTAIYQLFMRRNRSWRDRPRYPTSRFVRAFRWALAAIYVVAIVDLPLALWVFGVEPPSPARFAAAVALGLGALALLAWSLASLGENFSDCHDGRLPVEVVKHGPYRVLGHPIYVANVLVLVAITTMVLDVVMVTVTVVAAIFYAQSAREEERALRKVR
jgi:protein-S-isoprenylcysteine O-methyltransferase Ste14